MEALDRQLQIDCYPDVITYTILIEATCKESGVGQAMELLDEMRDRGCTPDVVSYNVFVNGICKEERLDEAMKFLNDLPSYGCEPNVITHNIILRSKCKDGKVEDAVEILNQLSSKGCSLVLTTYNTVIDGLSKAGKAIKLLEEMRAKDLKPDTITYSEGKVDEAIISCSMSLSGWAYGQTQLLGLCKTRQTDRAIDFLVYMINRGCKPTETSHTILIEGLAYELLSELCNKGLTKRSSAEKCCSK